VLRVFSRRPLKEFSLNCLLARSKIKPVRELFKFINFSRGEPNFMKLDKRHQLIIDSLASEAKMIKKIIFALIFAFLIWLILQNNSYARGGAFGINSDSISGPYLLHPTSEEVTIPKDGSLEFRWERTDAVTTDQYIFKLYKGRNTAKDDLILKKEVSTDEYPLALPASQFEDGQVYTWVLQQVFLSGNKSDKSFASFKANKQ